MRLSKKQYNVRFLTPAFLGDAEQKGAWRTPPFKALLRQWYRVYRAKAFNYKYDRLHKEESELFGETLEGKANKSRVLLRMSSWRMGKLDSWKERQCFVEHKEVEKTKKKVDAYLYLGYGPLTISNGISLRYPPAISQEEANQLTVIFPEENTKVLEHLFQLIHWFGTIGGRSRNGWGSFMLQADGLKDFNEISDDNPLLKEISRPLAECLKIDWPHALGKDERGLLIWRTKKDYPTWGMVMQELAQIKIGFRVNLGFNRKAEKRKDLIDKRHILAYPITKHLVEGWGKKERLANQIRFKVAKDDKGYFGLIYHLPCRVPEQLAIKLSQDDKKWLLGKEIEVWSSVHKYLDSQSILQRL